MEDLVRGLNLLAPKLEQMTRQIDQLNSQVTALKATVVLKADGTDVAQLRQQIDAAKIRQQINDVVGRSEQTIRRHVDGELQTLAAAVAKKADQTALAGLEARMRELTAASQRKVEAARMEKLEQRVQALSLECANRATVDDLNGIVARVTALDSSVKGKADGGELKKLVEEMSGVSKSWIGHREDGSKTLENLTTQMRSLNSTLLHKAEFSEVDQLKARLQELYGSAARQAEAGAKVQEQALARIQDTACEFQTLRKALESKADALRVEKLAGDVAVISDYLAPKIRQGTRITRPSSAKGSRTL